MKAPLLTTKFYIPHLRPVLVPRPRLIAQLNEGMHGKLTLVSAPAGFGKTTVVSAWAWDSGCPVAWVSLDEGDNDPSRFWTYVVAALQQVLPDLGEGMLASLRTTKPPSVEMLLTEWINEFVDRSGELLQLFSASSVPEDRACVLLVLDDYHIIKTAEIHEALTFFLQNLPPQLHTVIVTRADPALPLARLRVRAQMTELRAADLRFTLEETALFLNQIMGLQLSAADIAVLETRTEGWIAGLQLAALSMRGQPMDQVADFIAAFSGSHRHVIDYLAEEVTTKQPAEVQDFLYKTSILERLSAPLCAAVTDLEHSDVILRSLDQANLFLVPLDDSRVWYRYHHLFADFLRTYLEKNFPEQVSVLHRRASAWYEQHGFVDAAIAHLLAGRDFERAACLIEKAAEDKFMRSETATFLHWADALPEEVRCSRPLLCVYYAVSQLLNGLPLESVESQLQMVMESADASESISAEIAVFQALIASYQGSTSKSIVLSRQALEALPESRRFLRSLVAGLWGLNTFFSGDLSAAWEALQEAVKISRDVGNVMNTVLALTHLAELAMLKGQFYEAQAFYDQALAESTDERGHAQPIAGLALIGMGTLHFQRHDLDKAVSFLEEGITLIKRWGAVGAIQGYLTLARVRCAQRDWEHAHANLQTARDLAVRFDAMDLDDISVDLCQVMLWFALGDFDAVNAWVAAHGLRADLTLTALEESRGLFLFYRASEYIVLAKLMLVQGQHESALMILSALRQIMGAAGWAAFLIEILVVSAQAHYALDHKAQAFSDLKEALALALPVGYVRVFLEAGAPMAVLLSKLCDHQFSDAKMQAFVADLLAAFEQVGIVEAVRFPVSKPSYAKVLQDFVLVDPLSDRELEVLHLITAGLSNREIAEKLVIAISTVKTHINNIYRKLDVSSRTQAVARARALELL